MYSTEEWIEWKCVKLCNRVYNTLRSFPSFNLLATSTMESMVSDAGHHVLPLFSLQADLSRKSLPAVDVMELFGNILTGTSRTSVAANFCFPGQQLILSSTTS